MKFLKSIAAALAFAAVLPAAAASDVPKREHRALWMTPFLSSNWPSSAVTEANAESTKSILQNRLDKFKDQNINVIYYHARAMCDATYPSSYEPWASTVGGKRGQAPAFDVFGYLLEEAHKRGIEVYAWVNPYRYADGTNKKPYGDGERNYETTHPEWLIASAKQVVLNPGLEPVKQRVCDVIAEIVRNYDVDGVVFDDYFYGQGGTAMSEDADTYAAYTKAGGKLSQADWRRNNVNDMVKRVHDTIKGIKPHVVFGISPAGVSSPPNIATEYGLPSISGDWQYDQIYCSPLAWLKAGTIDFISPQIYWPSRFDELCQWWSNAALKFNRHLYASVDLSDITTVKTAEFIREVEKTREIQPDGTAGCVYFQYYQYVNHYERLFDGKNQNFGVNMQQGVYPTKALTPLRPWEAKQTVNMPTGVKIDGTNLVWNQQTGMRFTVYAYPKTETGFFVASPEYLHGITYTNSYALPKDADNYDWFVATYDRYGNETTAVSVGGVPTVVDAPRLLTPQNGGTAVDLFDFTWQNKAAGYSTVEVARDAAFTDMVGTIATSEQKASSTRLPVLETGKTYYWRVRFAPVNAPEVLTGTYSFTPTRMTVTAPENGATEVSLTPEIKWSKASSGAEYLVEVARTADMANPDYTATTGRNYQTVPAKTLVTGRPYYVRITASKDGRSAQSDVFSFSTVNKDDYTAPEFANPASEGQTLHSNHCVAFKDWDGMHSITLNISSSNSFPARSSYSSTLTNFATQDKQLSEVKISSKSLTDGATYYVRARGTYYLNGSQKNTDYTAVRSFKYNAEAGVSDITVDEVKGTARYYNLQGVEVAPVKGQLLIRVQDGKAVKEIVK